MAWNWLMKLYFFMVWNMAGSLIGFCHMYYGIWYMVYGFWSFCLARNANSYVLVSMFGFDVKAQTIKHCQKYRNHSNLTTMVFGCQKFKVALEAPIKLIKWSQQGGCTPQIIIRSSLQFILIAGLSLPKLIQGKVQILTIAELANVQKPSQILG